MLGDDTNSIFHLLWFHLFGSSSSPASTRQRVINWVMMTKLWCVTGLGVRGGFFVLFLRRNNVSRFNRAGWWAWSEARKRGIERAARKLLRRCLFLRFRPPRSKRGASFLDRFFVVIITTVLMDNLHPATIIQCLIDNINFWDWDCWGLGLMRLQLCCSST